MDDLRALAQRHHVDRVVSVANTDAYPSRAQMAGFGPVEQIGGVYVAPACASPPLTHLLDPPVLRTPRRSSHTRKTIGVASTGLPT
jgi:hypothetical protein